MSLQQLPNPVTWDECAKYINDDKLFLILRVRLFFLAMTQTSSTAPKAIEMLMGLGQENAGADLANVPTSVLEAARTRARAFLDQVGRETMRINSDSLSEQNGAGWPDSGEE